jgi:hypothetical protein
MIRIIESTMVVGDCQGGGAAVKIAGAQPSPGLFPSHHIPVLRERALENYADVLARHGRS